MRNILHRNAAWCWFQDPRANHFASKTYFTWVDNDGNIGISAITDSGDYATYTLRSGFNYDDHAVPVVMNFPDGKPAVFYAAHGGSRLYYRKGANVGSVTTWNPEHYLPFTIPQEQGSYGFTYPNPMYLSGEGGGKTFLYYRGRYEDPYLTTNIDDTLPDFKWTGPYRVFSSQFRPYMKVCTDGDTRVWHAVTDGHPLNVTENNIYCFYYEAGYWYNPDGTQIKSTSQLPITPSDLNASALVYDASVNSRKSWVWDIALDSNGLPVVTFAEFVSQTDHRYIRAEYDSTNDVFTNEEIAEGGKSFETVGNEPWYSGGIVLDHSNTDIMVTSEQVDTDRWDIKRYTKNGSSWDTETLTCFGKNVRPVVPRGGGPYGAIFMNGVYPTFTSFDTGYLGV